MFNLTEAELQASFEAIQHHGYSAMLPTPAEWKVVQANWSAVKQYLSQIDLDTYEPRKPLRIFAPKSRANARVVHLLHPEDLLIYTALVLIVKDDLEQARISKQARRVFSYRAKPGVSNRLYDAREPLITNEYRSSPTSCHRVTDMAFAEECLNGGRHFLQ